MKEAEIRTWCLCRNMWGHWKVNTGQRIAFLSGLYALPIWSQQVGHLWNLNPEKQSNRIEAQIFSHINSGREKWSLFLTQNFSSATNFKPRRKLRANWSLTSQTFFAAISVEKAGGSLTVPWCLLCSREIKLLSASSSYKCISCYALEAPEWFSCDSSNNESFLRALIGVCNNWLFGNNWVFCMSQTTVNSPLTVGHGNFLELEPTVISTHVKSLDLN